MSKNSDFEIDDWASPADYDEGYDPNNTDLARGERMLKNNKSPEFRTDKNGQMAFLSEEEMGDNDTRMNSNKNNRTDISELRRLASCRAPVGLDKDLADTRAAMAAAYANLSVEEAAQLSDEELCNLYDADMIERDLADDDFDL